MTLTDKIEAMVESGLALDDADAYAQLEDMGENDESDSDDD